MNTLKSVVLVLLFLHVVTSVSYRELGSFKVADAGFLNLGYFTPEQRQDNLTSLIISSFSGSPFSKDAIHVVENIGSMLNSFNAIKPTLVTNKLIWPNEATAVPYEIFSQESIGTGFGFLVPYKSTGGVAVVVANSTTPFSISTPKNGWFYHVALWWDMNGDGIADCVSARATVPTSGPTQGQLVWFENPGVNLLANPWEEHVLASGPDIMILFVDLEAGSQPQIVAAQFFTNELTLWWTEGSTWEEGPIQSRVIDSLLGSPFDAQFVDLNNDGKRDLLVTNHEGTAEDSAVFAYTVPTNWQTDPWPRYVLANNITTLKRGQNQASPGKAIAFYPVTTDTNQKPQILVGGDGAEVAFMLYPNSQSASDWSYTRQDVINTGCTVGQVVAGDVDGDSYSEFFVPAFEKGIVYGYTYAP